MLCLGVQDTPEAHTDGLLSCPSSWFVRGVLILLPICMQTHVINCAGKTGRPNVDWCEDHKIETIESNVIGTLMLAQACWIRDIHLTVMATGCKCVNLGISAEV